VIKLNIKFGRRSISLRELRSHLDHTSEADDHQGLDRYAIGFALELAGCIMFPDNVLFSILLLYIYCDFIIIFCCVILFSILLLLLCYFIFIMTNQFTYIITI
jgi:hypothetical protein